MKELDFPDGVSLIRSGHLEACFSPSKHVFSVLIIDYQIPLGSSTEPILSGLAEEITEHFEKKYKDSLEKQIKPKKFKTKTFDDFWKNFWSTFF